MLWKKLLGAGGLVGGGEAGPGTWSQVATATDTGFATSVTLNGLQQYDVVCYCYTSDNTSTDSSAGEYTEVLANDVGSAQAFHAYYIVGSGETSFSTDGGGGSNSVIAAAWRYSGGTAVSKNIAGTTATGAFGMPNPPSVTTTTTNTLVVIWGSLDDDAITPSAPSGYGDLLHANDGETSMLAAKTLATATTEDPASFGGSGTDVWCASTCAFEAA